MRDSFRQSVAAMMLNGGCEDELVDRAMIASGWPEVTAQSARQWLDLHGFECRCRTCARWTGRRARAARVSASTP